MGYDVDGGDIANGGGGGAADVNINVGAEVHDLVMIPSVMSNKQVYVGTLLAELCHDILTEFPPIVSPNPQP